MIDLHDEILIDFIAEAENYYQAIVQASSLLQAGQVREGVAGMLRPLHTIKGTAGFITGLEKLKTYTHQVEDALKKIQGQEQAPSPAAIEAAIRAVDEVFNLMEQVKQGHTELDDSEAQAVLDELQQALEPGASGPSVHWFPPRLITDAPAAPEEREGGRLRIAIKDGVLLVVVEMVRLHLAWQCSPLTEAVATADPRYPVAIDLGMVRTVSSTAWGEIWQASQGHEVALLGLRPAVRATYLAWGLDSRLKEYADREAFWTSRGRGGQGAGQ